MSNDMIPQDQVPEHIRQMMTEYQGNTGDEESADYAKGGFTFLKVVQGTGPTSNEFDKGAVLKMPDKTQIMGKNDKLSVTPLLVVPEFGLWYDYNAKPDNPIKERTYDKTSELARKCEPWARTEREIPDPENQGYMLEYKVSHIHALYFHELKEVLFVSMTGGEAETFRAFKRLRDARNPNGKMPIWAGRYEISVGLHDLNGKRANNPWMGFNFKNHPTNPFNSAEEIAAFEALHNELYKTYKSGAAFDKTGAASAEASAEAESKFG